MRTLQSGASWICKGQSNSCQVVEDVVLQKVLAPMDQATMQWLLK